jgi:hypothetical protein
MALVERVAGCRHGGRIAARPRFNRNLTVPPTRGAERVVSIWYDEASDSVCRFRARLARQGVT